VSVLVAVAEAGAAGSPALSAGRGSGAELGCQEHAQTHDKHHHHGHSNQNGRSAPVVLEAGKVVRVVLEGVLASAHEQSQRNAGHEGGEARKSAANELTEREVVLDQGAAQKSAAEGGEASNDHKHVSTVPVVVALFVAVNVISRCEVAGIVQRLDVLTFQGVVDLVVVGIGIGHVEPGNIFHGALRVGVTDSTNHEEQAGHSRQPNE